MLSARLSLRSFGEVKTIPASSLRDEFLRRSGYGLNLLDLWLESSRRSAERSDALSPIAQAIAALSSDLSAQRP